MLRGADDVTAALAATRRLDLEHLNAMPVITTQTQLSATVEAIYDDATLCRLGSTLAR